MPAYSKKNGLVVARLAKELKAFELLAELAESLKKGCWAASNMRASLLREVRHGGCRAVSKGAGRARKGREGGRLPKCARALLACCGRGGL